ncbi:Sec14p-like phosphatidylinositol transfer family protein [Klebsormidium nitens]|uniref:Sec14p-like phosphatidylinositol transfer family protein n=1 Tax=Klebsormidium nitens TaxID=105231 RepID=A0A1Y1HST6_KLENI|nr:Sec14p-like phosphatidylinositol transfer family protein [Klebsormidium nitens]|eukprot:GAQ81173.1 Sec14p-like phosphatidylinositol transfer family protein [Klebsormidium nitens]
MAMKKAMLSLSNSFRGTPAPVTTREQLEDEHTTKVLELRKLLGPLEGHTAIFCSDDCLVRYLKARNWNVKNAEKMLKNTIKWREAYKPEEIRWAEVAHEGETGKVYRLARLDKKGRPVVIMRPSAQNTKDHDQQIRHLVYVLENAVDAATMAGSEKIVWLIDFHKWSLRSSPPMKTSRQTLDILQNHFPERLGLAVCYNPPKMFGMFWNLIQPFVDPVTHKKVRFVQGKSKDCKALMEETFELEHLEEAFGGQSKATFDFAAYTQMMEEDERRIAQYWDQPVSSSSRAIAVESKRPEDVLVNGVAAMKVVE